MLIEYLQTIQDRTQREEAAKGIVGALCNRDWFHPETSEAYSGGTFRMLAGMMAHEMNKLCGFDEKWRMGRVFPCCKVCGHDNYCHGEAWIFDGECSCEEKHVKQPLPCGEQAISYPLGERAYFYCDFYNGPVPDSDPWVAWMKEKGFVQV
jgi:hypothetical protein